MFKGFIFDLDGTVYVSDQLIPDADRVIRLIRERGRKVVFLSNKPIQTREDYASKLTRLGIPTQPDEVINSTFVMTNYGALISDLIVLLDEVAFHSLDARLAKTLLDAGSDNVHRTHQQIADELGTAREVVSRQLKRFEQKGWVALGRGQVDLLNRAQLEKLSRN